MQNDEPQTRRPLQAYEITQPIIVHSRADIASLLRAHRIARKWTCEDLDAIAGFSDRYVTKLENGTGTTGGRRQGIHITPPSTNDADRGQDFSGVVKTSFSTEVWLETLGLRLVLMPEHIAQAIGAVPAPQKVVAG
ncbi:helix-turn-helix transcriptional regulator [Brevundimonas olei]|uniref:helix-turn-helix domain-containing protein n=1 Tax=Brevundimonas olei TaxID=657642 RepID=UPI0031DCE1F1